MQDIESKQKHLLKIIYERDKWRSVAESMLDYLIGNEGELCDICQKYDCESEECCPYKKRGEKACREGVLEYFKYK